MEELLHYVWWHKLFPLSPLQTTDGKALEVIDTGLPNPNAGPDFFNAKIKIDGILWVGNVEIHLRSSDWLKHHHDTDTAYDSVILHVVGEVDDVTYRTNGEIIPQLQLSCPASIQEHYQELLSTAHYPPCYRIIPKLSLLEIHAWMSVLQAERFEQKADQVKERLDFCNQQWDDAFFMTLARNFGFGLNGDAFEVWARHLNLRQVDKHRDHLFQVEAMFFGQAGLLNETAGDVYYLKLRNEYTYLSHKFNLSPMDPKLWRFLRLRPTNFPHVRSAQLAQLYHSSYGLLSQILEKETLQEVRDLLRVGTSEYWKTHYTFGGASPSRCKTLSQSTLNLLIINTVVTFLYAYGKHKDEQKFCIRASKFLEELKPENNYIIRMWKECGLEAQHAGDSQALIQLKKMYCDPKKCLYCRIGYAYLKAK